MGGVQLASLSLHPGELTSASSSFPSSFPSYHTPLYINHQFHFFAIGEAVNWTCVRQKTIIIPLNLSEPWLILIQLPLCFYVYHSQILVLRVVRQCATCVSQLTAGSSVARGSLALSPLLPELSQLLVRTSAHQEIWVMWSDDILSMPLSMRS